MGVAIGGWGMAIECCMHVVVCSVFPSPLFALATAFRFTGIPLLHDSHCLFCLPLPRFEFANGFRFTAIPLSHKCQCLFYIPLPLYLFAKGFRFNAIPLLHDCHCLFCSPLAFYVFANGFCFLRSHYGMYVTVCFVFSSLFLYFQMAFASPRFHSFLTA